jgi:murein DD-endopeptidase MepM/ murein hydrolase activator NlpD
LIGGGRVRSLRARIPAVGKILAGGAFLAVIMLAGCGLPRWPVDGAVTSPYGVRRMGTLPSIHRGVDMQAPHGTEVRVMSAGTVRFAGTMRGYGNVVWVDHPGNILTIYAHLSEIRVRPGERVRARRVIGLSGASGSASTPHLHFEVWRRGRPVDPVPLLGGFP